MSRVKGLFAGGLVLLVVLGLAAFSTPRASTNSAGQGSSGDGGQPMQALLHEVRQLRLAIQRSNLSTYHAQVSLERLRLQQQQVDRVNDKLGVVRAQLGKLQLEKSRLQAHIQRQGAPPNQDSDPGKRREFEDNLQVLKDQVNGTLEAEAQARESESQLANQLQMEQAKLSEINDRLDALRKELEIVDRPTPEGKRQ